jgi:hypothetical protein
MQRANARPGTAAPRDGAQGTAPLGEVYALLRAIGRGVLAQAAAADAEGAADSAGGHAPEAQPPAERTAGDEPSHVPEA